MSVAAPARPGRNVAVTVLGLTTLLLGVAYAALGGCLIFGGAALASIPPEDPAGGLGWLLGLIGDFMAVVGAAFLLQGACGMLAGLGVLWRRPWGRILTFILAVLAILWGLLSLRAYGDGPTYTAFVGAAQILYGLLAFVILIKEGAEFSRPRA